MAANDQEEPARHPADPDLDTDVLLPIVYEELHALARGFFRRQDPDHTLQPTALVHEAYLRLAKQADGSIVGRAHFMAVAARAMRQVLVNHARDRGRLKRGGGRERVTLDRVLSAIADREVDALELDEALRQLASLHERPARIVEMRVFGGLTVEEAAEVLQVGPTTVKADWQFARAWLKRALAADGT